MLGGKELSCSSTGEKLEATLGIPYVANAKCVENGVEAVHEDVPEERALFCVN